MDFLEHTAQALEMIEDAMKSTAVQTCSWCHEPPVVGQGPATGAIKWACQIHAPLLDNQTYQTYQIYHPSPRMARAIALRKAIYALQPGKIPPAAQMTLLIADALEQEADLAKLQGVIVEDHP